MNTRHVEGKFGKFNRTVTFATTIASLLLASIPILPTLASSNDGVKMAAAFCEIHIGRTYQSGNDIIGYGSLSSACPSRSSSLLRLQRSRWYGWEDLKTVTVKGPGYDQRISYNCAGTGKHDFRVIHTARTVGGEPRIKVSNQITAQC